MTCYGVVFYDYSGSVDLCFMIDVDGIEDILLNNKCVVINWYGIGVILLVSSYIIILLSVDIWNLLENVDIENLVIIIILIEGVIGYVKFDICKGY